MQTSCTTCPANTFEAFEGGIECLPCPDGYESDAGSMTCTSICGNGTINTDNNEACDDSNLDNMDGCDEACMYEENVDLEELNSTIDFESLTPGETFEIIGDSTANTSLTRAISCNCTWTLNPESFGTLTVEGSSCVAQLSDVTETSQANLEVEVSCDDASTVTRNQTLISTVTPESEGSGSSAGGCSLRPER
ncbi:DUF4215 domain-containing protein [bacterium]|nr:DUF4215 domain-containing protein [bacterium]